MTYNLQTINHFAKKKKKKRERKREKKVLDQEN